MEFRQIVEPVIKHGVLAWTIEDFLLCLTEAQVTLRSPIFSFADCFWIFKITVDDDVEDSSTIIRVHICRHTEEEDGPREIQMKFRLTLETPADVVIASVETEHSFGRTCIFEAISHRVPSRQSFCDVLAEDHNDALVIVWDVTAAMSGSSELLVSEDEAKASEAIERLLDEQLWCNALLIASDNRPFPVHKEILAVSSPVFLEKFTKSCCISIPFRTEIVRAMLRFIYSGRISSCSVPDLYQCAETYQISDLKMLLEPARTHVRASVACQEVGSWIEVTQFSKRLSVEDGSTHLLESFPVLLNVNGLLFCSHSRGKLYFKVHLWEDLTNSTPLQNVGSVGISATFNICDSFGQARFRSRKLCKLNLGVKESFLFHAFDIQAECLFGESDLLFPDDILRIECQFRLLFPGETCVLTEESQESSCLEIFRAGPPVVLSRMGHLLNSRIVPDVTVEFSGSEISAHRSILASRSKVLYDEFLMGENKVSITIPENSRESLLSYIYTGQFRHPYVDLLSLYAAGEQLHISELKSKCLALIKARSLTIRNVLKNLMFAITYKDKSLEGACKEYILANSDLVFGSRAWDCFKERNSALAHEITSFLKNNKSNCEKIM